MPGLFDDLKEGAFGIFTGGDDPRVAPGTGRREGLIDAGLATIASGNQDPLEALAIGAMAGRQTAQQVQERTAALQSRMALQEYVQSVGFNREGLQRTFLEALGQGDVEYAKIVGDMINQLPTLQSPESRLRAPQPVVNPETGEVEMASFDPDTGSFEFLGVSPPPETEGGLRNARKIEDPNSSTGWSWIGFDQNLGIERTITGAPPEGGSAAGPSGLSQTMAGVGRELVDTAFDDPGLRDIATGSLANISDSGGVFGSLANAALGAFAEDTQESASARRQLAAVITPMITGAQMTDTEREYYKAAFLPRVEDTDRINEQKRAAVILMLDRFSGVDITSVPPEQIRAEMARIAGQVGIPPASVGIPPASVGAESGLPDLRPGGNR